MTRGGAGERRAWVEQLMGMPVSIHLRGTGSRSDVAASMVGAVYDELRALDLLFSPYREDSEVSRVDRGEPAPEDGHPLLAEVTALCRRASEVTGGDFDAWRHDPAAGRVRFDPSGLVKGWAVQRAAERLASGMGCDVSVNAGGDVAVRPGRDGHPWRVGIEDPADPTRVLAVLPVEAGGVATSGNAHRGRHIVAPADGSPCAAVRSVTVVGPSLLWADVLATAAFVRGRDGGVQLVEDLAGYEALVVDHEGVLLTTSGLSSDGLYPGDGMAQRPHRKYPGEHQPDVPLLGS